MQKHTFHTIKTIGAPVAHPLRKPTFRIVHGTSWHNENNKKKRCKTLTIHSCQLAVKNRIEPSWSVKVLRCECPHTHKHANTCKNIHSCYLATSSSILADLLQRVAEPEKKRGSWVQTHKQSSNQRRMHYERWSSIAFNNCEVCGTNTERKRHASSWLRLHEAGRFCPMLLLRVALSPLDLYDRLPCRVPGQGVPGQIGGGAPPPPLGGFAPN